MKVKDYYFGKEYEFPESAPARLSESDIFELYKYASRFLAQEAFPMLFNGPNKYVWFHDYLEKLRIEKLNGDTDLSALVGNVIVGSVRANKPFDAITAALKALDIMEYEPLTAALTALDLGNKKA